MICSDMEEIFERLKERIGEKDRMHGRAHVERVIARAMEFDDVVRADVDALTLLIIVHGMDPQEAKMALVEEGVDEGTAGTVIGLMKEREAPKSLEAKIMHDAHFLEGDSEFFQIHKSLLTSYDRGENLEECVMAVEKIPKRWAMLSRNESKFAKREQTFRRFFEELSELMG